jgi:ATP synthase protein I
LTRSGRFPKRAHSKRGLRLSAAPIVARLPERGGVSLSGFINALADDRQNTDLDSRIAAARAADEARSGKAADPVQPKGYGQGSRVLMELIGAPLGGGLLGWALDYWFGTSPWLLLIFLALAIIVAFRNIYRISKERAE